MTGSESTGSDLGPCLAWVNGTEVATVCDCSPVGGDSVFDDAAIAASMLLYELSGRQFSGPCEWTVRPCASGCGCFSRSSGLSYAWSWTNVGVGAYWRDECSGRQCGCTPLSEVKLAGYPVVEILEVRIDGDTVDPSTYRLDKSRYLVRLDDPGPPVVRRRWPGCQNLALSDDEQGTFSIRYTSGITPPLPGVQAAQELACQIAKLTSGGKCDLPPSTTRVVRSGVTIDKGKLGTWLVKGGTGLPAVDAFLAAYSGGNQRARRPAIFTPDVRPFPRRVG